MIWSRLEVLLTMTNLSMRRRHSMISLEVRTIDVHRKCNVSLWRIFFHVRASFTYHLLPSSRYYAAGWAVSATSRSRDSKINTDSKKIYLRSQNLNALLQVDWKAARARKKAEPIHAVNFGTWKSKKLLVHAAIECSPVKTYISDLWDCGCDNLQIQRDQEDAESESHNDNCEFESTNMLNFKLGGSPSLLVRA